MEQQQQQYILKLNGDKNNYCFRFPDICFRVRRIKKAFNLTKFSLQNPVLQNMTKETDPFLPQIKLWWFNSQISLF